EVALPDAQSLRVRRRELDPGLRRRLLELARSRRLRARVEVVDGATGRERERVPLARLLVGRDVLRRLEERPPAGVVRPVLVPLVLGAADQVVAVALALLGARGEDVVLVQPLAPVRPLDAARAQPLVRESGVVALPSCRQPLELLERLLGLAELHERPAAAVAEAHPPRVL